MAELSQHLGKSQAVNIDGWYDRYNYYVPNGDIWDKERRGLLSFRNLEEIRCILGSGKKLSGEFKEMFNNFINDGFE